MIAIAALFFLVNLIIEGLILKTLWGWFVAETFNVHAINAPQALGITLLVNVIIPLNIHRDEDESWIERIGTRLFVLGFALVLGWFFHLFV